MPHITKPLIKSTAVTAKRLGLFNENQKKIKITDDKLPTLHYKLENPIEDEVLNYILDKDLYAVCWLGEPSYKIEETLQLYVKRVSEPAARATITSEDLEEKAIESRMLEPLIIDPTTGEEEPKDIIAIARNTLFGTSLMALMEEKERNSSVKSFSPSEVSDKEMLVIPPVWTPSNKEGNAMFLYVYFHEECDSFLPPEEIPDPPHVCMILPASKQRDVLDICNEYKKDVLALGFFTKEDLDETEFICKTAAEYQERVGKETDRIILKLARKTSHCELAFVNLNPIYVSHDTVKGAEDCSKVFDRIVSQ
jgi:thioredoxin domain-containing protein 3